MHGGWGHAQGGSDLCTRSDSPGLKGNVLGVTDGMDVKTKMRQDAMKAGP